VKRLALLALAALALGAAPAQAATGEYSTGNVNAKIGAHLDESLNVPQAGPVSFIRVSFRISAPDTSALAISVVSPKGTVVPLVTHRGSGPDFGADEKGCGGTVTVIDSDWPDNPIASGKSPFQDNPYRAEGNLKMLYGEEVKGRWTLRIENGGATATLHCLTFDISRAVPETISARHGAVQATVTYTERNYFYEHASLKITRAGRAAFDAPVGTLCSGCDTFRPVRVVVRDLDGGDPEVLLELYTQGAHCCTEVLALRYDRAIGAYRRTLLDFGNYGYKLADLDHDGLPEIEAFDERFVYRYGAYVFSSAPPLVSRYRQGRLVDVTRRFPALVRRSAAMVGKEFLTKKRPSNDVDLRTYVAVYAADQYLLGRPAEAKRALDYALNHGLLYKGKQYLGSPAGSAFVALLSRDLAKWGYLRPR
jgi:subtilisin-like proprotein convertase family protein